MNENSSHRLKSRLESMKAGLQSALKEHEQLIRLEKVTTSADLMSWVEAIELQQIVLELGTRKQRQLIQVQKALDAMLEGTYGICGKCGSTISTDRLEIEPEALFCSSCENKLSQRA